MSEPTEVLDTVIREVDAGRRMALCVVVATRGSAPQVPGAMVCVDEAAQISGTVGGGCVEAEIRRRAHQLLSAGWHGQAKRRHASDDHGPRAGDSERSSAGESPLRSDLGTAPGSDVPDDHGEHAGASGFGMPPDLGMVPGTLVTLDLDHDFGFDDGLICGGSMDVAISVISDPQQTRAIREAADRVRAGEAATLPLRVQTSAGLAEYRINLEVPPKLVIAGGGHIGLALATMMVPLGFHMSVIDDRSEFASAERFPPPINPVVGDIAKTLADWPIDSNTYVAIVTRGHKHDEQALAAVLDSPAKYIGMIGSRRKIKVVFDDLRHKGAAQAQLDRVHSPIGLDIKAVTPEEIAVSIAAELISIRRAEYRKTVEGPIPVAGEAI
ncbi:MAG: XdhC family protein [Phycisphaerales bacterium]|nr:MAG: XdhC family protein [Phycisphaerales bacterium]